MPKFRKKPVVIDAIQWTGDNLREIKEFMEVDSVPYNAQKDSFLIKTPEGNHKATKGDWIIKGVKDEFYPCKPDIFEMTYDKLGDVTRPEFDEYAQEIISNLMPNNPSFSRLFYPIKYREWQRDMNKVAEIIFDRAGRDPWYREFSDKIFKLISYSCLATKYVNEMEKSGNFKAKFGYSLLPERGCPHCSCSICHNCGKVKDPSEK